MEGEPGTTGVEGESDMRGAKNSETPAAEEMKEPEVDNNETPESEDNVTRYHQREHSIHFRFRAADHRNTYRAYDEEHFTFLTQQMPARKGFKFIGQASAEDI